MDFRKISESLQTIVMCVSTIVTCLLSYLVWESAERSNLINERATDSSNRINELNLELERYRQTIQLCDKVNSLYMSFNSYKTDDMVEFKLWELGDSFVCDTVVSRRSARVQAISNRWSRLDAQTRLEHLTKNSALTDLFYCFEDAMMLYRKGLLDARYFDNYMSNIISRLDRATSPTVEQFIDTLCHRAKRNDIWEGYRYCRDSIMLEPIIVPQEMFVTPTTRVYVEKINARLGEKVKANEPIILLQVEGGDGKAVSICSKRDGVVDKLMIDCSQSVRDGQIVMELRPR